MLDPLLQSILIEASQPVLVLMDQTSAQLWAPSCVVKAYVVVVGTRVVRLPATAAPFLANHWSKLTVIGLGPAPLVWFDLRAAVRPARYINLIELGRYAATIYPVGVSPYGDLRAIHAPTASFTDDALKVLYRYAIDLLAAVAKGDALYMDEYLAARNLLDLMSARGYHLPEALASWRDPADALLHPAWTCAPVPSRITTTSPPLHALPVRERDQLEARPGSTIVLVHWPEHVTKIASIVTKRPAPLRPGSDFVLGHHGAPAPPEGDVPPYDWIDDLRTAWLETQRPYPLPVPKARGVVETYSIGKLAQLASCAFTVQQLAALHRGWTLRIPALMQLSDVIPYLGSVAFQIDDRVPLPALHLYLMDYHAFHVKPVAFVGKTRGQMYPLLDSLTPLSLQFDKVPGWPVECPMCGGRADSERDLQQHFVEDHGQVLPGAP